MRTGLAPPCAGMMGLSKPTENTGGTKPVAHNDTVFAQVLKLVPRHEFESLARKHKSGRMSRSMTRWGQFVAMGMAQLTGRCSLRDIVSNLAAPSCKLYHLGVGVVTRSSLARVNAEKPWEMYEELHGRLLGRCQAKAPGHGYRFKAKLFSVDSTTIDLCLSAFPWAKFRRTKGAVKVHVGLDHEGYLPTFVRVTNGKTSDIEAARALTLPKGSIVAADRAYVDFAWIDSLISEGIHLVTRLKRGIQYGVVETREVNAKRGVTSDETIEFTSAKGRKQCPHRLRRIGYHDRKTGKDYVFLTTHFHLSAKTIADIYKSRWQVELFFKWIKQNLKVKSFVGTSRNAVMTQVWTAMCIYLILSYIKFANRIAWRLSEILRLLQLNLFERPAASGVAGKRKRESTGSFIPVDDEVHVDLVGQQCGHIDQELYRSPIPPRASSPPDPAASLRRDPASPSPLSPNSAPSVRLSVPPPRFGNPANNRQDSHRGPAGCPPVPPPISNQISRDFRGTLRKEQVSPRSESAHRLASDPYEVEAPVDFGAARGGRVSTVVPLSLRVFGSVSLARGATRGSMTGCGPDRTRRRPATD